MNIFRFCGDMSHLLSILILFLQLWRANNARGISVKTQELFLLVFLTRYLDLFTTFYSMYNSVMKMIYILSTASIICIIKYKEPIKSLYNTSQDSFPHWKVAVIPCSLLALITRLRGSGIKEFNVMELLWTFSVYLEAIAILPQLHVLQKYRLVENLTGKFVFFMGLYRAFYIVNWIYRSNTEKNYRHHWVVYICGITQTVVYLDFFYQYCKALSWKRKPEDHQHHQIEDENGEGLIFEHEMTNSQKSSVGMASTVPLISMDDDEEVDMKLDNIETMTRLFQRGETAPKVQRVRLPLK